MSDVPLIIASRGLLTTALQPWALGPGVPVAAQAAAAVGPVLAGLQDSVLRHAFPHPLPTPTVETHGTVSTRTSAPMQHRVVDTSSSTSCASAVHSPPMLGHRWPWSVATVAPSPMLAHTGLCAGAFRAFSQPPAPPAPHASDPDSTHHPPHPLASGVTFSGSRSRSAPATCAPHSRAYCALALRLDSFGSGISASAGGASAGPVHSVPDCSAAAPGALAASSCGGPVAGPGAGAGPVRGLGDGTSAALAPRKAVALRHAPPPSPLSQAGKSARCLHQQAAPRPGPLALFRPPPPPAALGAAAAASGAAVAVAAGPAMALHQTPGSRRRYQAAALTPALREDIRAAAAKKQTGVSLKYLLDFGTQPLERQMLLSARFLHAEIPIRLAHRLMDLNHLPPELSEEPHVRRVKGWYAESFADFRSFPEPIKDSMDVLRFTAMLRNAFRRHNNVVPAIAKGVEVYKRQLERTGQSSQERESEIQHFLDTFFLSRIAIRFLAGHHISMFEPPRPDHIGLVHTKCSPFLVASDAVAEARAICFREYGSAPQVTVLGNSELTMAYVPSHLHHMVFELVKNSLRAVQDRYGDSDTEPPPIQVVVADGLEDVTIKVSDQGGGIPRSGLQRIWTYLYTTATSPLPEVDIDSSNMPAVLAGYGCGLPLSRLYARYFGGDLQIISMEGYGTDAYLHLARLGNDEEPLPGAV